MDWLLAHLSSLSPNSVLLTLVGILLLCGLGVPIPEDISLISAGYLAHLGVVNVHTVFVACFVAVLVGDMMAFGLGWVGGRRLLQAAFMQRRFTPRKQRRVRAYFRKFGSKVIFVARFLPGVRFSIFFSAGCLHVRPSVFLIWDTLAAALSVPALVYLAYYFGEHIDHVVAWARRSEYGIAAIAVGLGIFVAIKLLRTRRANRTACKDDTPPTPPPPLVEFPSKSPASE
jgi:membrane protein DedA with SNARE-associated domain